MISDARQLRHHGVHLGLNSQASNLIVIEEAPLRPILFSLRVIACHCLFAFWRRINFAGSLLGAVRRAPARPRCTPSDERGVIWFSSFRCYLLTLSRIDSIHCASEDLDFPCVLWNSLLSDFGNSHFLKQFEENILNTDFSLF